MPTRIFQHVELRKQNHCSVGSLPLRAPIFAMETQNVNYRTQHTLRLPDQRYHQQFQVARPTKSLQLPLSVARSQTANPRLEIL